MLLAIVTTLAIGVGITWWIVINQKGIRRIEAV